VDFNDYQRMAQRTSNTSMGIDKVANGALGLAGEAGECAEIVKKHMYQGHELDRKAIVEELGDVLWYVAEAATGINVSLDEIAGANLDKLWARYPHGFDADRSIHREHRAPDQAQDGE
jgi:NTP pyrophosphatase (non-canonical NTP hydrolase)